ncbi:MAG TPA: MFS transporter [Polyangiaceae bacterium]|jgi:MFS family permease|nr:MFS transporter [Polyangiaceae bacterium]
MSTRPSPSLSLEPPSTAVDTSASVRETELFTRPFVLMLCVQFCFGLSFSTFFLLPKYLAREFHASASAIGAVAASAMLAGVAATPFIGAAIDRGARRPAITYGALVNGLSGCAFAWVHAISLPFYALRVVHGISYALVFNALVTLAADLAPPKKLGQAIGLCGAAGMIANAIAPAIAEGIADHQGWGLVFLLAGSASLLAALLSLGIREPRLETHTPALDPKTKTKTDANPSVLASVRGPSALALVLDPRRAGAFICAAAAGAAFGVMFTFTQPFALSLGASAVSSFFIGYTVCALSVRLFLGALADNLGRQRVAFGALVLYGLVVCMTSQLRPGLLFLAGAGLGLAHGLLYPAINALAAEGVPRARRGAVMSYFSACFYGGFALCAFGLGFLAKAAGYPLVFVLSGVLVWSTLWFLPKPARELGA